MPSSKSCLKRLISAWVSYLVAHRVVIRQTALYHQRPCKNWRISRPTSSLLPQHLHSHWIPKWGCKCTLKFEKHCALPHFRAFSCHLVQSKYQSPSRSQEACVIGLHPLTSLKSSPTTPPFVFSTPATLASLVFPEVTVGTFLPQGLCTGCSVLNSFPQVSTWPLSHHFQLFSHLVAFLVKPSLVTQSRTAASSPASRHPLTFPYLKSFWILSPRMSASYTRVQVPQGQFFVLFYFLKSTAAPHPPASRRGSGIW